MYILTHIYYSLLDLSFQSSFFLASILVTIMFTNEHDAIIFIPDHPRTVPNTLEMDPDPSDLSNMPQQLNLPSFIMHGIMRGTLRDS